MKALTRPQPEPALVMAGVKTIITLPWSTEHRGELALHAGAKKPRRIWSQDEAPAVYDSYAMDRYLDVWEDINNPGQFAYDWRGPRSSVVATCTLVDVVPIGPNLGPFHTPDEHGPVPASWLTLGGTGRNIVVLQECDGFHISDRPLKRDEAAYGDFTPGNYAWLISDVRPLAEPVPAKGRRGLWEWEG